MPITPLPLANIAELESRAVLKKSAEAHRYLAELKGVAASIPNEGILINTLSLQEAKNSSEIENIITTHDDLYRANLFEDTVNPATKEVQDYAAALKQGFATVRRQQLLRLADILAVQQYLEKNRAGLRRLPGTDLKNARTGDENIIGFLLSMKQEISFCANASSIISPYPSKSGTIKAISEKR